MEHAIAVWHKGEIVAHAKVDAQDAEFLSEFRWSLHNRGYAITGGGNSKVLMHRMILGLSNDQGQGRGSGARLLQGDHINGDKLDNRRANLRVVTNQENHQNRQVSVGRTSRHRGVSLHRQTGKWHAKVKTGGKTHWGGYYDSELQAAVAAWELRQRLLPMSVEERPA